MKFLVKTILSISLVFNIYYNNYYNIIYYNKITIFLNFKIFLKRIIFFTDAD